MDSNTLSSILLGTTDVDRLRDWYETAFGVVAREDGFIEFGAIALLIDERDDIAARPVEPGRVVLNFHVDDAQAIALGLERAGVKWLVPLESRPDGWFATALDADGNYIQIIELSESYRQARHQPTPETTGLLSDADGYSGFSVDDLDAARRFYEHALGLTVSGFEATARQMALRVHGRDVFVYEKSDHTPATYTILNFQVSNIDAAVAELVRRGVTFTSDGGEDVVARDDGPPIAWFSDPAGNILSVIEEDGPPVADLYKSSS